MKKLLLIALPLLLMVGCEDEKESNAEKNNGDNGIAVAIYGFSSIS